MVNGPQSLAHILKLNQRNGERAFKKYPKVRLRTALKWWNMSVWMCYISQPMVTFSSMLLLVTLWNNPVWISQTEFQWTLQWNCCQCYFSKYSLMDLLCDFFLCACVCVCRKCNSSDRAQEKMNSKNTPRILLEGLEGAFGLFWAISWPWAPDN